MSKIGRPTPKTRNPYSDDVWAPVVWVDVAEHNSYAAKLEAENRRLRELCRDKVVEQAEEDGEYSGTEYEHG